MARYEYDAGFRDRRGAGRTPRVTARYNMDYVEPPPSYGYPRNYEDFVDDEGPIIGADAYTYPYTTIGGTMTGRGTNRPNGGGRGRTGDEEGHGSSRPWVGGYRAGYQGGSAGIQVDTTGPLRRGYDRGFAPRGYDRELRAQGGYDREMARRPRRRPRPRYDENFDMRPEDYRPRFSPVGGMDAGMGGEYLTRGEPRPLRESRPTSEWTRWF